MVPLQNPPPDDHFVLLTKNELAQRENEAFERGRNGGTGMLDAELQGETLHINADWDFEGGLGVGLFAFGAALCRAVTRGDVTESLRIKLIDEAAEIARAAVEGASVAER